MEWSALNLIPFERPLIIWKPLGFQTVVNANFPIELGVVLSLELFHEVSARLTRGLYSDKATNHQRS
jgi:hypothetical protein